jgi:hypothetical protein
MPAAAHRGGVTRGGVTHGGGPLMPPTHHGQATHGDGPPMLAARTAVIQPTEVAH